MPRPALAILFLATVLAGRAAPGSVTGPALYGHIEKGTYFSANGAYKVEVPVHAETGGTVTDNQNVVTFQDDYNILYIIAAFPMDSSQRWELSIKTRQEYLQSFFLQYVLPDFRRAFPGVRVEPAGNYLPKLLDGALIIYTFLPGGSMFASKMPPSIDPDRKPPEAKRGNMMFVNKGFVYVISTELAERVTEGSAYSKTPAEEDLALREKLEDMVQKMHFLDPAPAP
jgi:hypothetical protein